MLQEIFCLWWIREVLIMHYDRITLGRMAKEYGFTRDVFEKVYRLAEI